MSVIMFSAEELAQVIACSHVSGSAGSTSGRREIDRKVDAMARTSEANAQAYNASYGDGQAEPLTAWEIDKHVIHAFVYPDKQRARRVLQGIRYNLIANNGQDFATIKIIEGLLRMASDLLEKF